MSEALDELATLDEILRQLRARSESKAIEDDLWAARECENCYTLVLRIREARANDLCPRCGENWRHITAFDTGDGRTQRKAAKWCTQCTAIP